MQESFDPNNTQYDFTPPETRRSRYSKRYKERQREDLRQIKKRRRIIFFDIILICLIYIFFVMVRPHIMGQERAFGYKFSISYLHTDNKTGQVFALLEIKKLGEEAVAPVDFLALYGDEEQSLSVNLPTEEGRVVWHELIFDHDPEVSEIDIQFHSGEEKREITAFTKRISFF